MNRLKKAFSFDRGDQKSPTLEKQKKRFSLFNQPTTSSYIDNSNVNSVHDNDRYRPRSVHIDSDSIHSFITFTSTNSNKRQTSIQSFQSDMRRSRNVPSIEESEQDSYLQMGMKYHEKGELERATYYWRLSAESGAPLGLFFYGIALRHGWGCKKNPTDAVKYLQSAAECAVYDLQTGIDQSVSIAKSELVLAIYELGVCFRHGWGVPKDLETAAYYFQIASNLGDPDAQNDLGFCYSHGLGVKKDLYFAAKYYRMAEKQGQGIIGNSWIWKEKYNQVEEPGWSGKIKR